MIRDLVNFFSHKTQSSHKSSSVLAGLYLHPEHLKLVLYSRDSKAVIRVETVLLSPQQNITDECEKLVSTLPAKTELCLVLSQERYQVVQLDKPAVADAEIIAALPYALRELSTVPLDDMLLDYMDLPEQNNTGASKIQVVVTALSQLKPLCEALQNYKIRLSNIQPEEWLVRNLLPPVDGAIMVITHQPGQELNLQVIRDQQVYFSRKLRGFNRVHQYDLAELKAGMLDNLLLEVQRSLDFYEGQLKQAPVREIYIHISSPSLTGIVSYFIENGFAQVKPIDLQKFMPRLSQAEREDYWISLAGALELVASRGEAQ